MDTLDRQHSKGQDGSRGLLDFMSGKGRPQQTAAGADKGKGSAAKADGAATAGVEESVDVKALQEEVRQPVIWCLCEELAFMT